MSTENIKNSSKENQMPLNTSEVFAKNLTGRVDINHLIARVRKEQSAENKSNLIFIGLFVALILIVGILFLNLIHSSRTIPLSWFIKFFQRITNW